MSEEEVPQEELVELLKQPDLLRMYGYQLTPKGCMALILMTELDLTTDEAGVVAQKMEDLIFMSEYIYVHESQLEVKSKDE